jgi:hypothetical protein
MDIASLKTSNILAVVEDAPLVEARFSVRILTYCLFLESYLASQLVVWH